jgi:hypothetical protein
MLLFFFIVFIAASVTFDDVVDVVFTYAFMTFELAVDLAFAFAFVFVFGTTFDFAFALLFDLTFELAVACCRTSRKHRAIASKRPMNLISWIENTQCNILMTRVVHRSTYHLHDSNCTLRPLQQK